MCSFLSVLVPIADGTKEYVINKNNVVKACRVGSHTSKIFLSGLDSKEESEIIIDESFETLKSRLGI